jgi:hypothetical protein
MPGSDAAGTPPAAPAAPGIADSGDVPGIDGAPGIEGAPGIDGIAGVLCASKHAGAEVKASAATIAIRVFISGSFRLRASDSQGLSDGSGLAGESIERSCRSCARASR